MEMLRSVKDALASLSYSELSDVADRSGVSVHTIIKIKYGQTADPRIHTVEPIYRALTNRLWRVEAAIQ